MKKIVGVVLFLILGFSAMAQVPLPVPRSGVAVTAQDQYVAFMRAMKIPVANDTTLNGGLDSIGSLVYRKIDSCIYLRVPVNASQNKWLNIMTSQELDTTSLSNRINQKLNISDTASMLSKYLRSIDTASLSARINAKLNISDTASMLFKYLRKTDTTAMLAPYMRKTDTASLSQRINQRLLISDTAGMMSKYLRKVDTASLSQRINQRLLIADTSGMLSPYLRKIDTFPRFNPISGTNMSITGTYPNMTFNASGGGGGSDGLDTVTTTNQMISYAGTASVLLVKDSARGGIFFYTTIVATPDSGTVFSATGKGGGVWIRRWDRKELWLTWFGAKGDGVTENGIIVRQVMGLLRSNGGGTLIIPQGTFLVSRGLSGGIQQMFLMGSNTRVLGQGRGKTILKLNPTDLFNFRRMFTFDAASGPVSNVEIGNLTIDMSNIYTTYPPPPEFGGDAQNNGIFTYSDTYNVSDYFFHDLEIINVTGDAIGISKRSLRGVASNIWQRDYLRQGFSLGGGGGTNGLFVYGLYDMPNQTVTSVGGHSIHSEPTDTLFNIYISKSKVNDFALSGISGGALTETEVYGTEDNGANFTSNFLFHDVKFRNSILQVAPSSPGNIRLTKNVGKKIYITGLAGKNIGPVLIEGNELTNDNDYNIHISGVSGVDIKGNTTTTDSSQSIYIVNSDYANVLNNTVTVNGGGTYQGIYEVIVSGSFGAGMTVFDGNIVKAPLVGIQASNISVKYGINIIDAPTKTLTNGTYSKIFPYVTPNAKQVYAVNSFPNYGNFIVGDVVEPATSTIGQPINYVCNTAGALFRGAWKNDTVYVVNEYVRDTGSAGATNYIYVSIAPGGQAEDPSNDTDNTYWKLASTTVAAFRAGPLLGVAYSGNGSPEGVVSAPVGSLYQNLSATNVNNILFGKIAGGTGPTGWDTLNTGGGAGGAAIESLNGQTNAVQTFATPVLNGATAVVSSSAGVHTIGIPVSKAIADSLAAQPVVNIYIQNLSKYTTDTILRVVGDSLKAKGILVTSDTGVIVTRTITDTSIIYKIKSAFPDSTFTGTVAQLRANAVARYRSAITTNLGGGTWWMDINDASSADNTGTVIVDAGGRRWKRIYSGGMYATWFNVIPDGATDNRGTLQTVINAMSTGDVLILPKGTIGISGPVDLKLGISIIGQGSVSSKISKTNGTSVPNLLSYVNSTISVTSLDSAIIIKNLTLDGNRANNTTIDTAVIFRNLSANGDMGLIMEGVNVINTSGPGAYTTGRIGITNFTKVEFLDNKIGLYTFGADAVYDAVNVGRSDTIGMYIRGTNNRFTNCKTWGVLPASNGYGVVLEGARNIWNNLEIQDIRSKALVVRGNTQTLTNVVIDRLVDSTNSVAIELNTTNSNIAATVTNFRKLTPGDITTNAYLINNVMSRYNNMKITLATPGARNIYQTGFTSTDTATYLTVYGQSQGTVYYPAIAGLYVPTVANTVNVSSSTVQECGFTRSDSTVTVYGTLLITPTSTSTLTSFTLTLPIVSDIPAAASLSGGGAVATGAAILTGLTEGYTTSDGATFSFYSTTSNPTSNTIKFRFSYKVR